jgi:transposase-like protein
MAQPEIKSSKNTKEGYRILPMKVRREAVEQWRSEEKTVEELCEKYSIGSSTLYNWERQVNRAAAGIKSIRLTREQKLEALAEIREKRATIDEIVERFQLRGRRQVKEWMREFAMNSERQSSKFQADTQNALNAALKRAEDAELRIIALEMLINEAESDLGVSIRKKSGSKQPKK